MLRLFALAALIASCGTETEVDNRRLVSNPCSVAEVEGGAEITCPDGSTTFLPNGKDGKDGLDGATGDKGEKGDQGAKGEQGAPGANGVDGQDGLDGMDGQAGQDGVDGKDGKNANGHHTIGYVGKYCGHTVVRVNHRHYLLDQDAMILLSTKWHRVSHTCEIRFKKGKVYTR